jgi:hypothetical protein
LALVVLGGLALDALLLHVFCFSFLGRGVYGFHAEGVVRSSATGAPIPHAHVIVMVYQGQYFASAQHCFGLIADEHGRFAVAKDTPYPLRHILVVKASGPGDVIGFRAIRDATRVSGRLSESFELMLRPLTAEEKGHRRNQYHHFCPGCPPENLSFLDDGWDSQYRDQ